MIAEVQNAVSAGKTVTIHQSAINAYGWTGSGYIETDTTTGAGAYLIEGKGNGGFLKFIADNGLAIGLFLAVGGLIAVAYEAIIIAIILGIIATIISGITIYI